MSANLYRLFLYSFKWLFSFSIIWCITLYWHVFWYFLERTLYLEYVSMIWTFCHSQTLSFIWILTKWYFHSVCTSSERQRLRASTWPLAIMFEPHQSRQLGFVAQQSSWDHSRGPLYHLCPVTEEKIRYTQVSLTYCPSICEHNFCLLSTEENVFTRSHLILNYFWLKIVTLSHLISNLKTI